LTIEKTRCYFILITGCYKNERNVGNKQQNQIIEPADFSENKLF